MSHGWSQKDFVDAYCEWLTENPKDRVAGLVDRVIQESTDIVAETHGSFTHYDALVSDVWRRLHEIPQPARQWYCDLVHALGFPWEKTTPVPQTNKFKTALKDVLHLLETMGAQDQTLTAIYRAWVNSHEKLFRLPKSKFTNTLGWTPEQIQNQLDRVLQEIGFAKLSAEASKWWNEWNQAGVTALAVTLKRAEEIATRGASIDKARRICVGEARQDWRTTLLILDADREEDDWVRRKQRGEREPMAKWESLLALPVRDGQLDFESMTAQEMESHYNTLLRLIGWPMIDEENRVSVAKPGERASTAELVSKAWLDRWSKLQDRAGDPSDGIGRMIRLTEILDLNKIRWDTFLRSNADKSDTTVLGQVYRASLYTKRRKNHFHLDFEYGTDAVGQYADMIVAVMNADDQVRQRMRWIPAGDFVMGSPGREQGHSDDEVSHSVVISQGYWMFDMPCTQRLWTVVMGSNPSYFIDLERPIEQVSWTAVQEFVDALNTRLSHGNPMPFRLPTEAEWEYACRAGTTTATYEGDLEIVGDANAPILDAIAWYGGNSGHEYDLDKSYSLDRDTLKERQYANKSGGTRKVGKKKPNLWGLYDMLGNVWEWCQDWYGEYPAELVVDPTGPAKGTARVIRGGCWFIPARDLRSACRDGFVPGNRLDFLGFRLLSSARQATESGEVASQSEVATGGRGTRPIESDE
jgi:formylglycine-generating enzyme required for sulfatase activity